MATDIFSTVRMNADDQKRSYQWYRNQIKDLGTISGITGTKLIQTNRLTTSLIPGQMYLFAYDPKHKATLPYYDTLPLVLPFHKLPDGFLGINLHYLPYLARFKLLGELSKLVTDRNITERSRIKISWEILNSSSKYLAATTCVKHYLTDHLKTRFLKIEFNDWVTAAMLPIEQFKKSTKENVWKETKKGYSY
jgi:hypothetical protein